jgi:23S rRNA pseudouridine1911/1915/1917 synthase
LTDAPLLEIRVVVDAPDRLDKVLAAVSPDLSRSRISALIKGGAASVNGRAAGRAGQRVEAGDEVLLAVPSPSPAAAAAEDLPLRIVYEDAAIVVVDKAPGMVVHPGAGNATGTLVNALLHRIDDLSGIGGVERPGIVHRLDRGTSGLLVVAKHDRAHRALSDQFAAHTAQRRYLAIVHRVPLASAGTIRSTLGRDDRDRTRFRSVDDPERGRSAVTHWRRLGGADGVALVECRLETGRTHQIRVHLTEAGHPLVGDATYRIAGAAVPDTIAPLVAPLGDRPLLHAWSLALDHPETGERVAWRASPPADFVGVLEALGLLGALPAGARPH